MIWRPQESKEPGALAPGSCVVCVTDASMDPGYEPVKIAFVNRCVSMAETLSRFPDGVKAYVTQRRLTPIIHGVAR